MELEPTWRTFGGGIHGTARDNEETITTQSFNYHNHNIIESPWCDYNWFHCVFNVHNYANSRHDGEGVVLQPWTSKHLDLHHSHITKYLSVLKATGLFCQNLIFMIGSTPESIKLLPSNQSFVGTCKLL